MDIHKFTACRYCADQIDVAFLSRHEAKCKTQTSEQRDYNKHQRHEAREKYRASVRTPVSTKKKAARRLPAVARKHYAQSVWANGNGKRLSATISIDFKSFREVLLQLAPMLSIDKVEVL